MPPNPLHKRTSSSRSSPRAPEQNASPTPTTKSSSRTITTKSTGPYDRNFQQKLIDGGVYPDGYEYYDGRTPPPPSNLEEIKERLARPRASLSPSKFTDEDFRKFKRADTNAAKEKQVTTTVLPVIEGPIGDAKCVSGGIPFTNLDALTDGTLVPGNPDIYYGARPEQLDRQVRNDLSGQIIPSTQDDLPILPNFMVAAKGPDGSLAVAGRQASYDGALGARGMHSLQSYGRDDRFFDNKAYTITSIYHGGQLKMFTSHPAEPDGSRSRPEYHMHQLRSFAMADIAETFRQGAAYYRNARDWARDQRDEAVRHANKRAGEHRARTAAAVPSPVQTSISGATVENASSISRDSRDERGESPSTTANPQDRCTPPPELGSDASSKRSSEQVKQWSPAQRKRRNPGEAVDEQSATQMPEPSGH